MRGITRQSPIDRLSNHSRGVGDDGELPQIQGEAITCTVEEDGKSL